MIIKTSRLIFILIIVFFIFSVFASLSIFNSFQKNNLNYWNKFIENYLDEKNDYFKITFFSDFLTIKDIKDLNHDLLSEIIRNDKALKRFNLINFYIVSVNREILYSSKLKRCRNFDNLSDSQILDIISPNLYNNDISIKTIHNNGSNFSLVISPLLNRVFEHRINLVYAFNNDYLYEKSLPFKTTIFWGMGLFVLFYIMIKIITFVIGKQIKNITNFIEKDIFEKNSANPYKLHYQKPFDSLERKITYLSAQRKEFEKKYIEISERFHYLISLTGEGLIMEDEEGYIYFCNNRLAKILDYDDESDIIGKKFVDLLYDEQTYINYENETKFRSFKPQSTYRVNLLTKKGYKKECLLTGSLIKDSQGNAIGYYGSITDISSLNSFNQDETELLRIKSEALDQMNNPIVIIDEKNNVFDANDQFVNYIKKNKSDLVNQDIFSIIHGFEIEKLWHSGNKTITGDIELFEPSLNKWFYVIVKKIDFQNAGYSIIFFLNITNLRKNETYHKFIFEDFKGFFFVTNFNNKVMYLSPSFSKITGNPESWFDNYFKSFLSMSESNNANMAEIMVVTHFKDRFEFRIKQLSTSSNSMKLFFAELK